MKAKNLISVSVAMLIAAPIVTAQSYTDDKLKKMISNMDDNTDKKVDFQEYYEESFTDNSDSYDVNKDGYITAGEVELEIKEDLVDTVDELRKHHVSEKATNATIIKELNSAHQESEAIINKMDTDGDELVEPDEIKAYKLKQFQALDSNHDGVLSSSDLSKKTQYKGYPIRKIYD